MIVAYPLTTQQDYTELRYSLRSLKHLPPYEVLIIGNHLPDWLTSVTQIELPDIKGRVQLSVRRKIYAALEYAEEILWMNDDFFLTKPQTFPYYFNQDLKTYGYTGSRQAWKELKEMGKQTKNFDLHYPMIFKQDFKNVMENFSADTLIRSAYCNYLGIEGIQLPDCKFLKETKPDLIEAVISSRPCFSTGVYSLKSLLPTLNKLYPEKSCYEV